MEEFEEIKRLADKLEQQLKDFQDNLNKTGEQMLQYPYVFRNNETEDNRI